MVVLKTLKNQSPMFNALSKLVGNSFTYNVIIDKKVVATLKAGEETKIELLPGSHMIYFKQVKALCGGSNKLTVNIEADKDYIIQAQEDMNGLTASYSLIQSLESEIINCPNCGAPNRKIGSKTTNCEYCGSPLK